MSFLCTSEISHAPHTIPVMGKIPQATPAPLVQNEISHATRTILVKNKSLCLLHKSRKRHSDRNNPIFYLLFSFCYLLLFFVSLTTLKRARSANTFGITIKALKKSDMSQTRFTLSVVPMMMQTTTIAEYSFTAPLPKRY